MSLSMLETAAMATLRECVAAALPAWRADRVEFRNGEGSVPHSELAMHLQIGGKAIIAGAIIYNSHQDKDRLTSTYAYIVTDDGIVSDGLVSELMTYALRQRFPDELRRHDAFAAPDHTWYITGTGWRQTPRDYKCAKPERTMLVNGGGLGTILVPVTLVGDYASLSMIYRKRQTSAA